MSQETDKLFAKGLAAGFAGGTVIQGIERSGVSGKSSYLDTDGGVYDDKWFADRAGGGQEIVKVDGVTYTRVYAGGTIPLVDLKLMRITKRDVMVFLKKQMVENGEKIRLGTNFEPEPEGDWRYVYKVLDTDPEIPLILGKETIEYKGIKVFVHNFIICPID